MKKYYFFLFSLFIAGCCSKGSIQTYELSAEAKEFIPYSQGQAVIFTKGATEITINVLSRKTAEINDECECCKPNMESETTALQSTDENLAIDIKCSINTIEFTINEAYFKYKLGSECDTYARCLNNVIINGKEYTNVLEFTQATATPGQVKRALYSKEYGFLLIEMEGEPVYMLKQG